MRITSIELLPNGSGQGNLARFTLELDSGVRIYNMTLRRNTSGELRAFAPSTRGQSRSVTFSPSMARSVIDAAFKAYESMGAAHAA